MLGNVAEVHEGDSSGGPIVLGPYLAAGGVGVAEVVLHGEVVAELEVRRAGAMDGVHCLGIEADAC